MTTQSVADIALKAFNGVAAKISGVIKTCTITRDSVVGTYNPATGSWASGPNAVDMTGQLVETTAKAVEDVFPELVIGPSDKVFIIRGLSEAPIETDTLTIGAASLVIKAVGDVVGSGDLYFVVAV